MSNKVSVAAEPTEKNYIAGGTGSFNFIEVVPRSGREKNELKNPAGCIICGGEKGHRCPAPYRGE
jgi:hypothetical protein